MTLPGKVKGDDQIKIMDEATPPTNADFSMRRARIALVSCAVVAALGLMLPTGAQQAPVPTYNTNAPLSPNIQLTPGDSLDVTAKDVCTPGYSKRVRNVPQAVKEQAYREYGILHREKGEYEVDHLISLELGGSNSIKNLWPQSYKTQPWNAYVKDHLEDAFHADICSGKIDIKEAQRLISSDWIAAYKSRFNTQVPLTAKNAHTRANAIPPVVSSSSVALPGAGEGQVWVNTKSGVYWRHGTRYYGKTKQGKFMSEADAVEAGYRLSGGH